MREIVAEIDEGDSRRASASSRSIACSPSVDTSQIIPKNVEGVKADPPTIFFSTTPAVLVNLDGEPIWSPIKDNDLKFAVNTNWDLFEHAPTKTYYLRNEQRVAEGDPCTGPWTPAGTLPASFSKLPADDNWKEVKSRLPGKTARRRARCRRCSSARRRRS